jgi:transposase-like protein
MAATTAETRQRVLDHQARTGDPAGKIALDLNLSPSTVYRVLREAGQAGEHQTAAAARQARAERAPAVRELAATGSSPNQICKGLRLGADTLKLIAAEHGIELPVGKRGVPSSYDEKIGEIRRLAGEGASQSEISRRMSVSPPTLSRWLAQAGIVIERDPGRTRDSGQASNFRRGSGVR